MFTETGLVTANGDTITHVNETSTGTPVYASVGNYPIVVSGASRYGAEQLHHHVCHWHSDGQPGLVDHHGQQRKQDLRHAGDLLPVGVHGNGVGDAERRHHLRRERDQHRGASVRDGGHLSHRAQCRDRVSA